MTGLNFFLGVDTDYVVVLCSMLRRYLIFFFDFHVSTVDRDGYSNNYPRDQGLLDGPLLSGCYGLLDL